MTSNNGTVPPLVARYGPWLGFIGGLLAIVLSVFQVVDRISPEPKVRVEYGLPLTVNYQLMTPGLESVDGSGVDTAMAVVIITNPSDADVTLFNADLRADDSEAWKRSAFVSAPTAGTLPLPGTLSASLNQPTGIPARGSIYLAVSLATEVGACGDQSTLCESLQLDLSSGKIDVDMADALAECDEDQGRDSGCGRLSDFATLLLNPRSGIGTATCEAIKERLLESGTAAEDLLECPPAEMFPTGGGSGT